MDYETTSPGDIPSLAKESLRNAIGAAAQTSLETEVSRATTAEASKQEKRSQLTNYGVRGSNIASASNIDFTSTNGDYSVVTGTTTITSITSQAAGFTQVLEFSSILTLKNSTNLKLPGNADIITANGDVAVFRSLSSGVWKCINYARASGNPVVGQDFSTLSSIPTTISGYGIIDAQVYNDSLQAIVNEPWFENSVLIGIDTNMALQLTIDSYTFLGRKSGNIEAINMTDFFTEFAALTDASAARDFLGVDASGSDVIVTDIVPTSLGGTGMDNGSLAVDQILYTSATGIFSATPFPEQVRDLVETPSSINFYNWIQDSTGEGSVVFSDSPVFEGEPLSTTPADNDNSTKIATTEFIYNFCLNSPELGGTPTTPTADVEDSSLQIANTQYVNDFMANSPELGGNPTATTQLPSDNSTKIATTEYVINAFEEDSNLTSIVALINEKIKTASPTGLISPFVGVVSPDGWVIGDGGTIGNASSNATNRADADTFDLFSLYWENFTDVERPIYTSTADDSTRGASALADFNANKHITICELRGEFVRFLDLGRAVDSGRNLGTSQTDQNKSHTHNVTILYTNNTPTGGSGGNINPAGTTTGNYTTASSGGTEARPRNVAYAGIIKL